jgi:predicted O-methyltransferase YrrM
MRLPVFRRDDTRPARTRLRRLLVQTGALLDLPPPARSFYVRALWTAWRSGDQYSFDVVTRPHDLREILRLAGDAGSVVELGTATAWTTIALALANRSRTVTTFDPVARRERERYLSLIAPDVRSRITLVAGPGRIGPRTGEPVDFLFIDGSHEREDTILSFHRWRAAISPGGLIAFHDYLDPGYPGVTEAIHELGLDGRRVGRVFVWTQRAAETAASPTITGVVDEELHRDLMRTAIARDADAQRALQAGDDDGARAGFRAAAGFYRESWEAAPPRSYGRLIGMLKSAVLAGGDPEEAAGYARSALADQGADSPPAAYAQALAALIADDDAAARTWAAQMRGGSDVFARTAGAIVALAERDGAAYADALKAIVRDFEQRSEHLTGVAIADTALMLERLAARRGLAAELQSPLLPRPTA